MISLLALDVLLLGHPLQIHAAHHFGHLGIACHFLHHVHQVAGSTQLSHHFWVNH